MQLRTLMVPRRLFRTLVTLVAVVGAVTIAGVPADASVFLGILQAGKPASPPFVVSPNFMTIGPSGAKIIFTISVKNLTTSPQTVTLNFNVHHVLTYYGLNVADGQPGQPGITFKPGDAPNTTQQLVGTPQVVTMTFPVVGSTTLTFEQTVNICGYFQVDVGQHKGLNKPAANLSASFTRVLGCQLGALGQRFTPGYWKNHQSATQALLPQTLGTYTVGTFAQATAIFDAMKCNAPANCLAGHLLAAQLDVSGGSSTCISATILAANNFLKSIGYSGPGSYVLSASQASQALAYEVTLDNYTNDSTSATC
jgi:hypothetical protein